MRLMLPPGRLWLLHNDSKGVVLADTIREAAPRAGTITKRYVSTVIAQGRQGG